MRLFRRPIGLAMAALVLGGGVRGQAQAAPETAPAAQVRAGAVTGNATSGKTLYYDYACYACHGYTGETGARAFVGNRSPVLASEDNFIRFLRGRAGISPEIPSTQMPSYSAGSLSDRQAKDLYAYIRTFTSHAPPLEQIEVMMQILKAASSRP